MRTRSRRSGQAIIPRFAQEWEKRENFFSVTGLLPPEKSLFRRQSGSGAAARRKTMPSYVFSFLLLLNAFSFAVSKITGRASDQAHHGERVQGGNDAAPDKQRGASAARRPYPCRSPLSSMRFSKRNIPSPFPQLSSSPVSGSCGSGWRLLKNSTIWKPHLLT